MDHNDDKPPVKPEDQPGEKSIKINPNPAANGNIPADEQAESKDQDKGVGSEITDGEGG